ncbi:MAG: hypothetical protein AB7O57_19480 [Hyphomicrobiaceae bacterium]
MRRLLFLAVLTLAVMLPSLVLAQEAEAEEIDLTPIINYAMEAAIALLAVLAAWAARKIGKAAGIKSTNELGDRIHRAIDNGLRGLMAEHADEIARLGKVAVKDKILGKLGRYVVSHVPDALRDVGLDDPTRLAETLEKKYLAYQEPILGEVINFGADVAEMAPPQLKKG